MAKERINDFVKTKVHKEESEVFEEFGIDVDILNQLITKEKDVNDCIFWLKEKQLIKQAYSYEDIVVDLFVK